VDHRILKLKRSRAAAGKRYYAEHEGTLDALIDAAFREASAAFQAAAEKMDAFRELERRHRVFQHSCGRSVSEPIADGAISLNSWRMWNYPANRRLHPPAPRTFSRPGDDPLVLG